jgi:hypothetical protein
MLPFRKHLFKFLLRHRNRGGRIPRKARQKEKERESHPKYR